MKKIRKSFLTGFQVGIEAINANVAVIDRNWDIVITNTPWKRFGEENGYIPGQSASGNEEVYENYLEVLRNAIRDGEDTALKAFIGINAVMNAETEHFALDYPCHEPNGRKRWFRMQVMKTEEFDLVLLRHQSITQLHNAEQALLETENRLSQFFQSTTDGIITLGADGRVLDANPGAMLMLRYDPEEILSEHREGLFDLLDVATRNLMDHIHTNGLQRGEARMKKKSGQSIDVELTATGYTDVQGEYNTHIIFRDISNRKKEEGALVSEKKISESIINSLPGVVYMVNQDLKFVRWNRNLVRVTGYSDDELREMLVTDLFADDTREMVEMKVKSVFDDDEAEIEAEILNRDGEAVPYRLTGVRFDSNDSVYLIGTGLDMMENRRLQQKNSELLRMEREARRAAVISRNEMEKMIQYAPSPVCFLEGADLRITIINDAFKKIIGIDKLTGRPVMDITGNIRGEAGIEQVRHVFESAETFSGEEMLMEIFDPASEVFREYYLNIILQPVKDSAGEINGVFIQAMDVTELVRSRIGLQESLREKQVLIEEVHHRVKNNLAIITGLLELQIDQEEDERTIYKLRDNQLRIYSMAAIHEMLYHNERLSEINFAEYIRVIVDKILLSVDKPEVSISWDADIEPVILSVNQAIPLAMILNELVSNACKHAFSDRKKGHLHIGLSEEDGSVNLSVKDNGRGFDYLENQTEVKKLGATLIELLGAQLGADLSLNVNGGTRVDVRFDKEHKKHKEHKEVQAV
ncbi:MAG: PAS domain S-box protein [Cyclonatronaceae bacterium]